jgi:hypothetical protein
MIGKGVGEPVKAEVETKEKRKGLRFVQRFR